MKHFEVIFAHLIKGCRPLWQTRGVLIPSPCVNTSPEPFTLKVRRPHLFQFFQCFSSNKCWWRLRAFSFHGRRTRESRVAACRRVGCDRPIKHHLASLPNLFLRRTRSSLGFSSALCLTPLLGHCFEDDKVKPPYVLLCNVLEPSEVAHCKNVSFCHWSAP